MGWEGERGRVLLVPVAAPGLGLRGRPWRRGLCGDMETVSELELGVGVLWQAPAPRTGRELFSRTDYFASAFLVWNWHHPQANRFVAVNIWL